jgi:RIO kinase 1
VVDVVANPQGPAFLTRDVQVMATWFAARGVEADAPRLTEDLLRVAGMR